MTQIYNQLKPRIPKYLEAKLYYSGLILDGLMEILMEMKKLLSILTLTLFIATNLNSQPVSTDENWTPTIRFNQSLHDFGSIPEGPKAYHEFVFTNTGREPVVIERAQASCGCTVPEISKEPVAPGKTGTIKVEYNSDGRPGNFDKSITVYVKSGVNRDKSGSVELKIKGVVNPKTEKATESGTPSKPVQYKPVSRKKGS
jgi:hypothetical protein